MKKTGDRASVCIDEHVHGRMPDGKGLYLFDTIRASLRSAFIVSPWDTANEWAMFNYGLGQLVPGTQIMATKAHTNIPRCGDIGLPKDWEAWIDSWRASLNVILAQPVLDWAAETDVEVHYCQKRYSNHVLLDLLSGARSLGLPYDPSMLLHELQATKSNEEAKKAIDVWNSRFAPGVHLRECISYGAIMRTGNENALHALQEWLRRSSSEVDEAKRDLDAVVKVLVGDDDKDPKVKALLTAAKNLSRERTMMGWIHLEGLIKTPVC